MHIYFTFLKLIDFSKDTLINNKNIKISGFKNILFLLKINKNFICLKYIY